MKERNIENNTKAIAVIQGPIISYGQPAQNYSQGGFDVVNSIIKNIKTLNRLKIKVVISTWTPTNEKENDALKIISKKIPKYNKIVLTNLPNEKDLENRYKQQLSTINGLNFFKDISLLTPTFKLRTDQIYDKEIIEYCLNSKKGSYIVSEILDFPFYLGDFLHFSNYKNLKKFFSNSIHWDIKTYIHPATVQDLTIKNLIKNNYINKILANSILGKIILSISAIKKWSKECSKFEALPKDLYFKIIWRDKKMSDIIKNPPLLRKHNLKKIESSNFEFIKYIYKLIKNFIELYFQIVFYKKVKKVKDIIFNIF